MFTPLAGLVVAILYFAFSLILWTGMRAQVRSDPRSTTVKPDSESGDIAPAKPMDTLKPTLWFFWFIVLAHAAFIGTDLANGFPRPTLTTSFSLTLLLMLVALLLLCIRHRLQLVLLFFAPMAGMSVLVMAFNAPASTSLVHPEIYLHLSSAFIGASVCLLTLPLALICDLMNRSLHTGGRENRWLAQLPPLSVIESLIVRLVWIAVVMLLASILFALPAVEHLHQQHLVHKSFFSVIALLLLSTLLYGHNKLGWRGKKLVKLIYTANISLILAYFGTKFVLEVLLKS